MVHTLPRLIRLSGRGGIVKEPRKVAAQYRALAAALRALIPEIKMNENRHELQTLAEKYEKLAQRLEHSGKN